MTAGQQLGSLLIDMGFIDAAQLESALEEQQRSGMRLGKILVRAGVITEERLVHALSRQLGIEPCDPIMTPIHERVLALVPAALAFKHHVLPIARQREDSRDCLYVATSDPLDKTALQALRAVVGTNTRVRWMLAGETEMELALARHYGEAPKPSSDIPVIQGRPVSGPVERASAFSTPPRGVSPSMGQSTADIAAALSVAMGETPLPASRMQSMGSKDLLPLSSGETSDDILIAEDVVESGAFPAVNELVDAVHRPPEVNLDDALAAAFDEEVRSAPPPLAEQATQQSGLSASSPFVGDASSRDPADVAIDEAFAGLTSESESSNAAVDAALAGISTDPGVAPEAPGDDDAFPPPEPLGAFAGVDERGATNGTVDEAPTSIPEPTAPEPAAQDVDTGPSWGDLLDPAMSWGSSSAPTSAPTGAPTEDFEIPEPADSALPTMIAEPEPQGVDTVDASPEVGTQTVDAEVPEGLFGAPGEMIGAPGDDGGATSSPQFGGSAEVPPADAEPEVPADVTPDLANTVTAERVSAERVTPDLANTVTVDRVQRPSAGAPASNEAEIAAPGDVDAAVVRALADVGAEPSRGGAGAEPSPLDVGAESAAAAGADDDSADDGAFLALHNEPPGGHDGTPEALAPVAAEVAADDEGPRSDPPEPIASESAEAHDASAPSAHAPAEAHDTSAPEAASLDASAANAHAPAEAHDASAPEATSLDASAANAHAPAEAHDTSAPEAASLDASAPIASESAEGHDTSAPEAPSLDAADEDAPRRDVPPPADVATLPDPPPKGAASLPHHADAPRPLGADNFVHAEPDVAAAASPPLGRAEPSNNAAASTDAPRPLGADDFVHAEPGAAAASPDAPRPLGADDFVHAESAEAASPDAPRPLGEDAFINAEPNAGDAPLPLGADAFAHAERVLDPDAPVPLPAEALVEAPSDADDLPDASEDIELAEVAEGPPTGEHVRALVEQFAAGAALDDEDTIVVMRALAAALLEAGRFDDEHLAALIRRLTPPVT